MLAIGAIVEDSTENLRMERLDAAGKELREAGQLLDIAGRHSALDQKRARAAGREDLDAAFVESRSELEGTALVRKREERRGLQSRRILRQAASPLRVRARPKRSSSRPRRASSRRRCGRPSPWSSYCG